MCEGYAATVIVEEAAPARADLIVIGTHGRSGLKHLLLGSIAERVVQKAPCPVLTVKRATPEAASARRNAIRTHRAPPGAPDWHGFEATESEWP